MGIFRGRNRECALAFWELVSQNCCVLISFVVRSFVRKMQCNAMQPRNNPRNNLSCRNNSCLSDIIARIPSEFPTLIPRLLRYDIWGSFNPTTNPLSLLRRRIFFAVTGFVFHAFFFLEFFEQFVGTIDLGLEVETSLLVHVVGRKVPLELLLYDWKTKISK